MEYSNNASGADNQQERLTRRLDGSENKKGSIKKVLKASKSILRGHTPDTTKNITVCRRFFG